MRLCRTVQLLATTVLSSISFFSNGYKQWIRANEWMMWVSLFGAIGFMVSLLSRFNHHNITTRHN